MTARPIERDDRAARIALHEASRYTYDELRPPQGESHVFNSPHLDTLDRVQGYIEDLHDALGKAAEDTHFYVVEVEGWLNDLLTGEQLNDRECDPPTIEPRSLDPVLDDLNDIERVLRGVR